MPKLRRPTREATREARRLIVERAGRGEVQWPDAIREIRSALGMTQEEFGRLFNLTRRQISEMENGSANPTLDTMSRIGRPLGLTVGFVPERAALDHRTASLDETSWSPTHLKPKVFFGFHYERDLWRVNVVRNSGGFDAVAPSGWTDAASWEALERDGDAEVKRRILEALGQTSATIVCIGAETSRCRYIDFEIERSVERGNVVVGVRIDHLPDQYGRRDVPGPPPASLRRLGSPVIPFTTADNLARLIHGKLQQIRS